jgi:hypothetical protein
MVCVIRISYCRVIGVNELGKITKKMIESYENSLKTK